MIDDGMPPERILCMQVLKKDLGDDAEQAGKKIDWLTFKDLEESVRDDLKIIKQSPLIPSNVQSHGFVYDVSTTLLCIPTTEWLARRKTKEQPLPRFDRISQNCLSSVKSYYGEDP